MKIGFNCEICGFKYKYDKVRENPNATQSVATTPPPFITRTMGQPAASLYLPIPKPSLIAILITVWLDQSYQG